MSRRTTYRLHNGRRYRYLWAPDHPAAYSHGYVPEHRMVAYDAGLLDDTQLAARQVQIRHLNGDTLDNRPDNLWVGTMKEAACTFGHRNQIGTFSCHPDECQVDGCDDEPYSGGLCPVHFGRWQTTGDPLGVLRVPRDTSRPYRLYDAPSATTELCDIAGCDMPRRSLGLCGTHRRRLDVTGDPLGVYRVFALTRPPYRLLTRP